MKITGDVRKYAEEQGVEKQGVEGQDAGNTKPVTPKAK